MSERDPMESWTKEDIDRMVELLEEVSAPGFRAYVWNDPAKEASGEAPHPMMGASLHPAMEWYWKLNHDTSAHTDPYAVFPEDPTSDGEPFSPALFRYTPESFVGATLAQVRRYLSLIPRGERFAEGYLGAQVQSGAFQAALKRLRTLRESL